MVSRLKKYVAALASAKEYVAQWSSEHVYANEALIIPFPTLAIFNPERNIWSVHIKAWLYLPFEGKKIKGYISSIPNVLTRKTAEKTTTDATLTEDDDDVYEDASDEIIVPNENPGRLGFFFVGNSVKVATKSIINGAEYLLQPSDETGFIEEQLEFSDQEIKSLCPPIYSETEDRKFDYEIKIHESKTNINSKSFKCSIYVLAPAGVSIISDIDDTIKITKVLNKRALLKHTFYSYFKPVDGMNELYQSWFSQNCQFHYVSGSPWQLYPALRCFLEKYQYPMGTMNLRKFAWSWKFLKLPDTYKIEIITLIIHSYPTRKYICVGDSGELDPEIYSKLFVMYPQNIAHIFIRDICGVGGECLSTCQERYEKAFAGVPKERWTVFKDPKDVQTNIQELITI
jgi:hypothetical protein